MKSKKKDKQNQSPAFVKSGAGSPELIEKFYKQIVNSFGYAYSAKV